MMHQGEGEVKPYCPPLPFPPFPARIHDIMLHHYFTTLHYTRLPYPPDWHKLRQSYARQKSILSRQQTWKMSEILPEQILSESA